MTILRSPVRNTRFFPLIALMEPFPRVYFALFHEHFFFLPTDTSRGFQGYSSLFRGISCLLLPGILLRLPNTPHRFCPPRELDRSFSRTPPSLLFEQRAGKHRDCPCPCVATVSPTECQRSFHMTHTSFRTPPPPQNQGLGRATFFKDAVRNYSVQTNTQNEKSRSKSTQVTCL
jgi:hypothetical protein